MTRPFPKKQKRFTAEKLSSLCEVACKSSNSELQQTLVEMMQVAIAVHESANTDELSILEKVGMTPLRWAGVEIHNFRRQRLERNGVVR